jgi:hypothetical protein
MGMAASQRIRGLAAHADEVQAKANSIVYHALMILQNDWRDLVTMGVRKAIQDQSVHQDPVIVEQASRRKIALRAWEKATYPFAWAEGSGSNTANYARLITILCNGGADRPTGLPEGGPSITYDQLATNLYIAGTSPGSVAVSAPISLHGAFTSALPVMITMVQRLSPDPSDTKYFIHSTLAYMLKKMQIHFIPWHRKPTENQGRGKVRAVRYNWWMMINRNPGKVTTAAASGVLSIEAATAAIADEEATSSPSAPWSLPDQLHEMGKLWEKTILPTNWSLEAASLSGVPKPAFEYMKATYNYVETKYNGSKWWHHLALIIAILVSRITPRLFRPADTHIPASRDAEEITRAIRAIPWVETSSTKKKGCKDGGPYITMMSTAIIALLDAKSPLSLRMKQNAKALGTPWTDKHGT